MFPIGHNVLKVFLGVSFCGVSHIIPCKSCSINYTSWKRDGKLQYSKIQYLSESHLKGDGRVRECFCCHTELSNFGVEMSVSI